MKRILLLTCLPLLAQTPPKSIDPTVKRIVDEVSEERMAASMKKLESFGTRHILSPTDDPSRGTGAARRWLFEEFQSYSSRLQVSYDKYRVKKQGRLPRDVELVNVIAVLPGTLHKDRHLIISGHYDSLASITKPGAAPTEDDAGRDEALSGAAPFAPGVTDDASGVAAVLELARVMSHHEFKKTIVFIAFDGEEVGLFGSRLYAAKAKAQKMDIEAVLNNDIIGSELAGNGTRATGVVRVFSDDPNDSPSRALARFIKETSERYVPSMRADVIFRPDRFGRGGDHTPFNNEGFAAVRFTTPAEHYENQHTVTDTFANTSAPYAARVARVNAAALASLAMTPKPPDVTREVTSGLNKGRRTPSIARGKSRYDAVLRWANSPDEPDLAGYAVVMRSTLAPFWEREIYVGNVREYTLPDVSIDDVVFGVKAIDKQGHESLVSAYVLPPRREALTPVEIIDGRP